MSIIPGSYFPENLASYNFGVAAVIGIVIVVLVVGLVIGTSKGRSSRKRPE